MGKLNLEIAEVGFASDINNLKNMKRSFRRVIIR